MRRVFILALCLILCLDVCFAEVSVFPDSRIMSADIYSVKDDSLIRKQFSLEIPRLEDPAVSLTEHALSGCAFLRLYGIEYGNQIYTVLVSRLSSSAADQTALYCFAIAQTLIANGICDGVNVLIDGVCHAYDNTPINTVYGLFEGDLSLPSLLEQHKATRRATIYLPDRSGKYIVSVPSPVPAGEFSYKGMLSLIESVDISDPVLCPMPSGFASNIDISKGYDPAGRFTLSVNLRGSDYLGRILDNGQFDEWQLWASICFSLFTNCPGTERVRFLIDNSPIATMPSYSGAIFETNNGELSRLAFAGRLGVIRNGYEINVDGNVSERNFVLPCRSLKDPVRIIESCVPGINTGDILEAYISGRDAYVCLSERFYNATKDYDLPKAHEMYFAMVNALCADLDLKRVKFLANNKPAEVLPCGLTLEGFLYPDPGLGN